MPATKYIPCIKITGTEIAYFLKIFLAFNTPFCYNNTSDFKIKKIDYVFKGGVHCV